MNEIIKEDAITRSIVVDGSKVETFSKTFDSCNIITVEVGTTGYMGGDTGHGGRTYLRISDDASTDMRCRVISNGTQFKFDNPCDASQIEIIFGGDTELETFAEALRFAADVLDEKRKSPNNLTRKEKQKQNFCFYLNSVCEYYRETGKLKGLNKFRSMFGVSGITIQQFFELELNKVKERLPQEFCDKVYEYILDRKNNIPAPKYQQK